MRLFFEGGERENLRFKDLKNCIFAKIFKFLVNDVKKSRNPQPRERLGISSG